jgi:hypothetical protein
VEAYKFINENYRAAANMRVMKFVTKKQFEFSPA